MSTSELLLFYVVFCLTPPSFACHSEDLQQLPLLPQGTALDGLNLMFAKPFSEIPNRNFNEHKIIQIRQTVMTRNNILYGV